MMITIIFVFQESISVTRPSFYSERFQKFFMNSVFRKAPSREYLEFLSVRIITLVHCGLAAFTRREELSQPFLVIHILFAVHYEGCFSVWKEPNFDPFLVGKFSPEFHKNSQSQTNSVLCLSLFSCCQVFAFL